MPNDIGPRKRPRACDYCRKKKARCNRSEGSRDPCSLCLANSVPCTFLSISRRRGSTKAYAAKLETRVQQMQRLLEKYASKDELEQSLGFAMHHGEDRDEDEDEDASSADESKPPAAAAQYLIPLHLTSISASCSGCPDEGDEDEECGLSTDPSHRFYGKSSDLRLLQVALEMKQIYSGNTSKSPTPSVVFDDNWPAEFLQQPRDNHYCSAIPPNAIVQMLFDLFSSRIIPIFPLMNWHTFTNQYADGFHERDPEFARLLLMVCAVASTFSSDRRVYQDVRGVPVPGYEYYSQSQTFAEPWRPPTLTSLRIRLLTALYLQGVGDIPAAWVQSGAAIRVAEDFGAHRKKSCPNEQWKRVVWSLVVLDRQLSAALGRSPSIQEEDFDIDLPTPLPDDGEAARDIETFSFSIRLATLTNTAMRTIYTVRPSVVTFFGPDWEKRVVTELDSALKTWLSSFPAHLRWDPDHMNPIHLEQSALMHCSYLHLTIMVHRALIFTQPAVGPDESEVNICVNAARSSIRILSAIQRRRKVVSMAGLFFSFVDAIILLTHIWSLGKTDPHADVTGLMSEVQQCISLLRNAKGRCQMAIDRFVDCLVDLSENIGDAPPPDPTMDDLFGATDFLFSGSYEDDDKTMLDPDLDDYLGLNKKSAISTPSYSFDSLVAASAYYDVPSLSPYSPAESWRDFSGGDTESDCSHNIDTPKTPADSPAPADAVQDNIFKTWCSSQANIGWDVFGKFLANVNGSAPNDKDDSSYNQSVLDYLLTSSHDPAPIHSINSF